MENTELIIWDMDGVKYPIDAVFQNRYTEAIAKAASILIPDMPYDTALALAWKSKNETHKSMRIFVDEYGLDYMTLGMTAEPEIDLGCLTPSPAFIQKLEAADVKHIILTEGNPAWATRILTHMQLDRFYSDRLVITKADYPNDLKRSSRFPFELALQKTGNHAHHSLMIEDSEDNLYHPKDMGMTTVLIDASASKKQTHQIDYIFPDPITFLDEFIHRRKPQPS